jgi:hypothetical protein
MLRVWHEHRGGTGQPGYTGAPRRGRSGAGEYIGAAPEAAEERDRGFQGKQSGPRTYVAGGPPLCSW